MIITIMQGDAYAIPVELLGSDGQPIDDGKADTVEVAINKLHKIATYSNGFWLFPISQKESFSLTPTTHNVQIRVKFPSGDVIGVIAGQIDVKPGSSKEVL